MTRLIARWHNAGPVWRYALPLVALSLVVWVDWLRLRHEGVATRIEGRHLLFRVGVVCLLAAVVMLIGARKWRVQGLGLLAFLFGVGDFFVRLIGQWGPQPVGERERDLVQALLDVGGVGLFLGLLIWFTFRIIGRGATDAPSDDINGGRHPSVVYDRRKNVFDRRRRPPPPKPPS